jgi:hypothetical protein
MNERNYGDIADIDTPSGRITVMYLGSDPRVPKQGYALALTLDGSTEFVGNHWFPPGTYGPGDVGPISCDAKATTWR